MFQVLGASQLTGDVLIAEYVKRFAKQADADDTADQDDKMDASGSEGFLSSSDDEDDLPANGGMT